MKPDLLITHIKHCDYPLWRQTLRKHRDFFGKIIIYFSEHYRFPYFDRFIQSDLQDLGNIVFPDTVESRAGIDDWRQVATTEMLRHSTSEWVCSIEQDWFAKDWDALLSAVATAGKEADLIGWYNETAYPYIHPAFWFIKREALEMTSKDFSAHPDINGSDHFATITQQALLKGIKLKSIQDLGFNCSVSPDADCFHLGGVNQNFLNGLTDGFGFHRPEIFAPYNYQCRQVSVARSPKFDEISTKLEDLLKKTYPITPTPWDEFFKV